MAFIKNIGRRCFFCPHSLVNFHRALPKHLLIAGNKFLVKNELTFHIFYNFISQTPPPSRAAAAATPLPPQSLPLSLAAAAELCSRGERRVS